MRSKIIHEVDGERTFAVILETGDEVMASLNAFATENNLTAANFTAIGALSRATLAFFDWDQKEYLPIPVDEQVEVASLIGDIATGPDGKPAVHAHAVLGKSSGAAVAGHLQAATVRPTLEIILTESPGHLRKRYDPAIGIALVDPGL
ncbi:PPC domain-containing DNA-binding protein [Devosia sp.]|uniref:PPC domain-containing DNA-binding protein n=1 Tax=Devosia sp. TaxID=1871048 RepID=UPI001B21E4AE|nr:PPC domain-containing DNA-binding protein [Devosia sp.]MBO9590862.1 DNA-binding protein [Devosia sp.]